MKLFDTHCHLQDEQIQKDIAGILSRAEHAGVIRMLSCSTAEKDWHKTEEICSADKVVLPAFGIHPWYLSDRSKVWSESLQEILARYPSAAIGEIGIDHAVQDRNDAEQEDVFTDQLAIAIDMSRPFSLHCRKAWQRLLAILKAMGPFPRPFVLHSYSGGVELIKPLSAAGAYFSFSGSITRPNNKKGRVSASTVPLDKLLIETDSPDLYPSVPEEDQQNRNALSPKPVNEPANLVHVISCLAQLRKMDADKLADILWDNSVQVFGGHQ